MAYTSFMSSRLAACLLAGVLAAAVGCSGRGFAEVTGTVRVDGKPVQGAFVTFTPDEPGIQRGVGSTNAEGRYRVIRPGSRFGAAIGANTVSVTGGDQGRSLPESVSAESTLKFEVKSGRNVFDIDIPAK
jgi:hypothetical protein